MSHPASCANPDTCPLSYRDHLLGIAIAAAALPTRAVNRTPGQPDEPAWRTEARQRRWDREHDATEQLVKANLEPPSLAEAPRMLQELGG